MATAQNLEVVPDKFNLIAIDTTSIRHGNASLEITIINLWLLLD